MEYGNTPSGSIVRSGFDLPNTNYVKYGRVTTELLDDSIDGGLEFYRQMTQSPHLGQLELVHLFRILLWIGLVVLELLMSRGLNI